MMVLCCWSVKDIITLGDLSDFVDLSYLDMCENGLCFVCLTQAEPSPTTGTFPLPPFITAGVPRPAGVSDASRDRSAEQSFVFKPFVKSAPRPPLSPLAGLVRHLTTLWFFFLLKITCNCKYNHLCAYNEICLEIPST